MAYSWAYAPREVQSTFYELGVYSILFYFTHVVTIVIVANFVFWLKDVDPRFKDGEWLCGWLFTCLLSVECCVVGNIIGCVVVLLEDVL